MKPTTVTSANELAFQVANQTEKIILKQLGSLIERGILSVRRSEPMLVQDSNDISKIELRHGVELVLSNEEYVQELEAENKRLKHRLETMREILTGSDKYDHIYPPSGAV